MVEVKTSRVPTLFINWTGTLLRGVGETLVLLYLLLASGDLFLQKLVRVMPTLHDKKRAVEISHGIQQNISNYLFSVSVINIGLGNGREAGGLYFMGVPNAVMWGMLVAVLNFVPYFGPIVGVLLLATVGLLTFDTLWQGLLAPAWYLLLHLLEANLITPILLGRRFTLNPAVVYSVLDLLDLALGCAWGIAVSADSGFGQSGLRPFSHAGNGQRTAQSLRRKMVMLLITLPTPLMSVASLVTRLFSASFLATPPTVTTPSVVEIVVCKALVERCDSNEALTSAVIDASSILSPLAASGAGRRRWQSSCRSDHFDMVDVLGVFGGEFFLRQTAGFPG